MDGARVNKCADGWGWMRVKSEPQFQMRLRESLARFKVEKEPDIVRQGIFFNWKDEGLQGSEMSCYSTRAAFVNLLLAPKKNILI